MNDKANKVIYTKCKTKPLSIKHVCEVGVYKPQTSNILDFINDNIRTTLVEPVPEYIKAIQVYFKDRKNIHLHPYAIYDYNGSLELVKREASTYVGALESSPALVNDNYTPEDKDKFSVECKKFDEIDDGSIDLLSVDTEGCEWYVLKNMKSRPSVISLETHGKSYLNPFYKEITSWIKDNNYFLWYRDSTDTVYCKAGVFDLTMFEKLSVMMIDMKLLLRKLKHQIKNKLVTRPLKG